MIARYRLLLQRIQQEVDALERTQTAVQRHWQSAFRLAADQDAYVNSVALNLHSFYSRLERIFELIADEVDDVKLRSGEWHLELVRQMTVDMGAVRPPVLDMQTAARLDELRRFRHLVRNSYTDDLAPERMRRIVEELPALWQAVRVQLTRFSAHLDDLSHADEIGKQ